MAAPLIPILTEGLMHAAVHLGEHLVMHAAVHASSHIVGEALGEGHGHGDHGDAHGPPDDDTSSNGYPTRVTVTSRSGVRQEVRACPAPWLRKAAPAPVPDSCPAPWLRKSSVVALGDSAAGGEEVCEGVPYFEGLGGMDACLGGGGG